MTPASDPYRTLGLDPGASTAEIKRAYRRLAKAYHPDSAGERALPRFLAIQAAYERLTADQPRARPASSEGGARGGAAPTPPSASRPWSADAERARATRDAFRKRSTRTGPRPGTSAANGASGASGSGTHPGSAAPGSTGPGGSAGAPGTPGSTRTSRASRRGRPKATIGSTSYDGTESEPFEPGWSGAGWYGAASGTYWTINPKEYADPRKHGPEYLARAKRTAKPAAAPGDPADGSGTPPEAAGAQATGAQAAGAQATGAQATANEQDSARPGRATSRGRAPGGATAGSARDAATGSAPAGSADDDRSPQSEAGAPRAQGGDAPPTRAAPSARSTPPPQHAPAAELLRAPAPSAGRPARFGGLQPASIVGSRRGRLLLAALAWFPIGLAIFGVHGQVTGCSQFLASCTDAISWSVWIPQLTAFALLLASPRLAWIAASGTVLLLCLTVPLAAILTAGSGGRPASVETTDLLYVVMAAGWLAGVAIALSGQIPLPPWRAARVR